MSRPTNRNRNVSSQESEEERGTGAERASLIVWSVWSWLHVTMMFQEQTRGLKHQMSEIFGPQLFCHGSRAPPAVGEHSAASHGLVHQTKASSHNNKAFVLSSLGLWTNRDPWSKQTGAWALSVPVFSSAILFGIITPVVQGLIPAETWEPGTGGSNSPV